MPPLPSPPPSYCTAPFIRTAAAAARPDPAAAFHPTPSCCSSFPARVMTVGGHALSSSPSSCSCLVAHAGLDVYLVPCRHMRAAARRAAGAGGQWAGRWWPPLAQPDLAAADNPRRAERGAVLLARASRRVRQAVAAAAAAGAALCALLLLLLRQLHLAKVPRVDRAEVEAEACVHCTTAWAAALRRP